uniref:Uncharacterized protein n=1 Tax=Arundo donax TaxID=35708 RepID=A0A0A9BUC9_ARUDO
MASLARAISMPAGAWATSASPTLCCPALEAAVRAAGHTATAGPAAGFVGLSVRRSIDARRGSGWVE